MKRKREREKNGWFIPTSNGRQRDIYQVNVQKRRSNLQRRRWLSTHSWIALSSIVFWRPFADFIAGIVGSDWWPPTLPRRKFLFVLHWCSGHNGHREIVNNNFSMPFQYVLLWHTIFELFLAPVYLQTSRPRAPAFKTFPAPACFTPFSFSPENVPTSYRPRFSM